MKKYYLAYGSNLNIEDMKLRCPSAKVVGTTNLEKYRLVFKGGLDNYSYLTIEDDDNGIVPVGVFEIDDIDDFKRLDVYEGYPILYDKKIINIQLEDVLEKALIYIMRPDYDYHIPSTLYFKNCLIGYKDFDFDKDILVRALYDTKKEMTKSIPKIKLR